ncbi:amidohydrolase [Thermodesulfobacteriota bacterium]
MRDISLTILRGLMVIAAAFLLGACDSEECRQNDCGLQAADIVLLDGHIWTADDDQPSAESVAVRGDRIIAVGSTSGINQYIHPRTRVIHLNGKRVVPGFQDAHTHFIAIAAEMDPSGENPFSPQFVAYNEFRSRLTRGAMGLVHLAIRLLGSTPMDLPCFLPCASPPEEAIPGIRFGMRELAKMGITTVFEAGADWEHYEALARMKDRGDLKVRCELYMASRHLDELIDRGIKKEHGDEWLKILGVKFYADGWVGPRTCALGEGYLDETFPWQWNPDYRGVLYMDQEKANRDILKAHRAGLKIATHSIGDRATTVILNAYENALHESSLPDHRYTIEHAQVLTPELIQRIRELEVITSIQLSFATTDMHHAEEALGPERTQYAYAWRRLLDAGIRCAGGSDFPIETLSPLWGIQRIVTRRDLNGEPEGGWYPDQCITVEEALRLITIDSAYNSFEEETKGSIEAGKLADLVVLSQDILEIPPDRIAATDVEMTMVGGEIVHVLTESGW